MNTSTPGARSTRLARSLRATPAIALLLLLAACGGGGVVPSTSVATVEASRTLTPEFAEYSSRKAVAYSPFRSSDRDTELVTPEMIKQDLDLLVQGDFRLIRLFDSSINSSVKVVKSNTAEAWAGTSISINSSAPGAKIPFSATATTVTLRVWAAAKDVPVRLKVEDAANPNHAVETEAKTTVANAWQTLSFDFSKPAAGTPPLNLSYTYNKGTVFFNFGKTGAQGGGGTFYVDDPILLGDDGSQTMLIVFENKPVVTGFGGAEDSTIVSTGVAENVLQVIRDHNLDIKMQLGAYILSESSPYISDAERAAHRAHNQAEVQRAITLAKEFEDIVLAVSIGNETMIYWSFVPTSPEIMAAYIAQVRSNISQPVTTDDNWAFWASAPKIITDIVDFAAVHTYCELDTVFDPNKPISQQWKQGEVAASARAAAMMDAIMDCTKADYQAARDWLDLKGQAVMPIVIGETGWNAVDVGALAFRAHPVNQKMYFQALQKWKSDSVGGKGPVNVIYFEAFDEPWKGNDDKWGLFNVQRQARYVVQNLYPQSLWEPGNYTTADALYWVPMSNDPVSASRYTPCTPSPTNPCSYAENFTLNEHRPATPTMWNAWENGTTAKGDRHHRYEPARRHDQPADHAAAPELGLGPRAEPEGDRPQAPTLRPTCRPLRRARSTSACAAPTRG